MCGFGDEFIKNSRVENEFDRDVGEESAVGGPAMILMVKNPKLGTAKTRLAKTIGDEAALKWYLFMLKHTRETARLLPASRYVFYSSFVDHEDEWNSTEFHKEVQTGEDLGQRMQNAFRHVFAQGHKQVLIIGSDCLDLRPQHLKDAVAALHQKDFVLGPASDGGYYLLGMRSLEPKLFESKTWSTENVLKQTLGDINSLGKSVHLLEELSDVDFEEDLMQSLSRLKQDHEA